jgi:hypothetical protein
MMGFVKENLDNNCHIIVYPAGLDLQRLRQLSRLNTIREKVYIVGFHLHRVGSFCYYLQRERERFHVRIVESEHL